MEPIIITAFLKPKEGFQDQVLSELKKVQLASRQEAGCVEYNLNQSVEDGTFVLYEVWKDNEALDHHTGTSHYQEYRNNMKDFITSREVYKMRKIN